MAYSNVGTPVFYIDNYLYHKTIGTNLSNIAETGDDTYDQYAVKPSSYPNLYNLSPSIAKNITIPDGYHEYKMAIWTPMPSSVLDYDFSGNMKWYWAILNHDIPSFIVGFASDDSSESAITVNSDSTEVLNGGFLGDNFYPLNGSSIITYSENLPLQHSRLFISSNDSSSISPEFIGAVSTGIQYTMPHSPDLNLTMEVEFDGVKTITTSGGGSISNVKYSGNPLWVNGDNKTNPFDVYEDTLDVTTTGARRNGRKSWSLKFSFIADTDLFSSNPRASSYTEHPNDSTYETSDLDGLDADGNPISTSYLGYNIETDDSFYAQVWNKTLGGALPFIFQPNSNDRDDFYICKFDQDSLRIRQSAYKVYDISVKIVESW